jgi:hypothetical protein
MREKERKNYSICVTKIFMALCDKMRSRLRLGKHNQKNQTPTNDTVSKQQKQKIKVLYSLYTFGV